MRGRGEFLPDVIRGKLAASRRALELAGLEFTLSALDRFVYLPHAPYVVEQMKGLHRAERKRKMGWRM